ncbi:MAG: amidohydrolase family protein, partial [Deltaproteobacteria bacterium]
DAIASCTLRPARLLGVEAERGTLRVGARADLAVLDGSGRVLETWLGGRVAWRSEGESSGHDAVS